MDGILTNIIRNDDEHTLISITSDPVEGTLLRRVIANLNMDAFENVNNGCYHYIFGRKLFLSAHFATRGNAIQHAIQHYKLSAEFGNILAKLDLCVLEHEFYTTNSNLSKQEFITFLQDVFTQLECSILEKYLKYNWYVAHFTHFERLQSIMVKEYITQQTIIQKHDNIIAKHKTQLADMERQLTELRTMVEYMPFQSGYYSAKEDFEENLKEQEKGSYASGECDSSIR